jgi:sugar transferase (PEP-CTERM/EpsH1 system associated)
LRLLFLTPQVPYPPQQGTTIRNLNIITRLARRHQVTMLSFAAPEDSQDAGSPLPTVCEAIHTVPRPTRTGSERLRTALTSSRPDMAYRLESPAFRAMLERLLASSDPDVIEFEGIEMIPYLPSVLAHVHDAARRPRIVFDDHNAEYVLQQRVFQSDVWVPRRWPGALYSLVQWKRLRAYEAWACRCVDIVAAVSEQDADALRRLVPGLQVHVIPNGVDLAYYARGTCDGFLPPNCLVFTGKMDFRPNVDAVLWFADRVLPLIRQQAPDVQFYIVGQRPHARLQPLRSHTNIVITGHVPDQRPYIGGATVYVIPLRSGGGTRLKVLEAMAMGRPIVSTSMGCDGFPITPGREAMVADDPESFAHRTVELLWDAARRTELGRAGQDFAKAHYDWDMIVPLLERTYESGGLGSALN